MSVDLAATYPWTGYHSWSKGAQRGRPVTKVQSGKEIVDSAILLKDNYVTLFDVRKTTEVSFEAPLTGSWGGNFGIYVQHKVQGTCGQYGTLTGGIRAQVETTQAKGAASINDACAGYLGLYNNGSDVGGFGLHVDAYHVGVAHAGHSTYGISAEIWKEYGLGTAAAYVGRSQGISKLDFGLVITHAGESTLGRGVSLGCPAYFQGGIQGASGNRTVFDVGIDLTWGSYRSGAAIQVPANSFIVLSGVPQATVDTINKSCQLQFDDQTGMFAVQNGSSPRLFVNMTTGVIWQNGQPTWAAHSPSVDWVFAVGAGKRVASRPLPPAPDGFFPVLLEGRIVDVPFYNR